MKKRFISSFIEAKFLIARCLTLLILALLSTNLAWGEIVTLTENFSSSKATTNNYDCSSAITTADNQKDWNYAWTPGGSGTVFKNGIKLGKSGGTGSVSNSTMLADIPTGTSITIKIYAAVWNTDGGKVKFTYNGKDDTKDAENGAITSTTSAYSASDFASATEFSITKVEGVNEIKIGSSQKRILIDKVEVIYDSAPVKTPKTVTVSGSPTKTEYYVGDKFDSAGLTVTATYEEGDPETITSGITWTIDPEIFTSKDETSVTVKATVGGVESSAYTVNDLIVKTIANTQETAYTVAEARSLFDANPAELGTTEVYVKGTVSKIVTEWSSQYGNISFDVSADGQTTGDQFQFFRNFKGADKSEWTSAAECPAVGDDVIGYGTLTKFNSTYEFAEGNYLVSHVKASTIEIKDITVEINGDITPVIETNVVGDYTMSYTSNNENVVLADGDEMVTMGLGTATITATLTAEGYKNATTTFEVTVIKALQSITVKTAPTTSYKAGDKFDPTGLVITAKYNDESTEDVAYAGNEDKFTFTPSLETALTTDVTSVTITYAGKEATQAIIVRALYTYNITWMANGEQFTTTQVTEGDVLALPETNPEAIDDFVFKGWINTENYYDAETAPTYIVPETITPTEAMRFYAVFAKEKAGETTTVTKDIIAEAGLSNSLTLNADVNPYQIGELPITLTGIKGTSNFPAINVNSTSGTDLRFYKGTTCGVTFATTNGQPITKIEFKKNAETASTLGNTFSANVGTLSANVWTGSAESVTISYSADATFKEQMYIINVTYSETSVPTYSNYCTTITAANMAITDAKWGTFCAPFDVALEEGVKAYTASEESGTIKFTEVDGTIEAGTPVVVYSAETIDKNYFGALAEEETCTSGVLVGVYTATSDIKAADDHTNYVLQNNSGVVGFYKVGETSTISLKANRCYMTLPTSSSAKDCISLDGAVTGINEILNPTKKSAEGIFDLNGRKLATPQKGINIINGVKVIVK